jgi:NAD(P)-dependent dehydrogenase (short-subunit alcohol dehydrogenase family)
MEHFKDKVALVTGGGSGIGQAVSEELGRRGSIIVVADINEDCARQVASAIAARGGRARAAYIDVSNEQEVEQLVDATVSEYEHLDYMFNNAGIVIAGDARDLALEQWRRVIAVDLWGVLYGTLAAYPVMVRQGFGHIVNTASLAGLAPYPTNAPYSTSKHAVVGFSLSLRFEAADLGVKVSVVCPGYVRTNIYQAATIVNVSREPALSQTAQIPFKMMEVSHAAHAILRGVERNDAIIVFPGHAIWLWRLYRLHPSFLNGMGSKMVRDFRKIRISA